MGFESSVSKKEESPMGKRFSFSELFNETVARLKDSKVSEFSSRIALLITALGVMGTTELSAQNRQNLDSLIRATRENVASLDSAVRANPTRRGRITINGRQSESFERTIGGQEIRSNDFYICVIEERGTNSTVITADIDKDGIPDQIVIIPGKINGAEKASIINELIDNDAQRITVEAGLSDIQRQLNDRPALHRTVIVLDQPTHKWQIVNFEDGRMGEIPPDQRTTPQAFWSATSAQALDGLRQGIR